MNIRYDFSGNYKPEKLEFESKFQEKHPGKVLGVDIIFSELSEEHQTMWEAWNTGRRPDGYDTYDNEFGKTYAYYAPFTFNGNKMGVIGAEVTIASVNKVILNNTLRLMAGSGVIMILCVVFLLWILNKRYISKIGSLESSVRKYAIDKNAMIVGDIEKEIAGKDEISFLSKQVVEMILELVKDGSVLDVFKRADKAMYARKRAMKAARRS